MQELPRPYYDRDGITIYHGDCREVLPRLTPVDLVLTDPPYVHAQGVKGGGLSAAAKFYRDGALDGLNEFNLSGYADLLLDAAPMMVVFHSRDLIHDYAVMARKAARKYDLHVWHKTNAIPFTGNTWKSDIEYIALIWSKKPGWRQQHQHLHSKAYVSPINTDRLHPTSKPIPLLRKYAVVLGEGPIIDPFMGSGTTLAAAKLEGRKAVGIEINEKYCEIAAKRLEQGVLF